MKHTIVIDTSALLHRSKHSLGMQLSNKDMETGIMFGFCIQIGKLASKFKTNRMVFCLDGDRGGTSKRKKIFPDYKVKRAQDKTEAEIIYDKFCFKQFASIIEKFRGFGFKNIVQEPGFEGDDLVASFLIHNPELAKNAIIASSDNDFYQLLHLCRGMILMKKGIIYDKHSLMEEYGIIPQQWKDVKMIAGCFDEKTEILTDSGWKKFKNLSSEDRVFSMDPTTQVAKYCSIDNYISYEYSGDMYRIKGKGVDAVVTPNHSFFGDTTQSYINRGQVKFKEIQEIVKYKNFTIPLTVNSFIGNDRDFITIPDVTRIFIGGNGCRVEKTLKGFSIKSSVFMAFLGIYLADGYTTKNRNGKIGKVGICKSKPKKVLMIKRILDMMGVKYNHESGKTFIINNVPLAEFLHPIGNAYTKRIPVEFKNMSSKYLKILWSYMVLCDGATCMQSYVGGANKTNKRTYYTVNSLLAKDFQEIVVKSGLQCSIKSRHPREWDIKGKTGHSKKQYTAYVKKSKHVNICGDGVKVTVEPFDGIVYDVETKEYHTILVRRNKTVYWSSNCKGDEVPGVPGVGYPTAAKYLRGELTKGKVFDKITSGEYKDVMRMARRLTTLPFKNTPPIIHKKDKNSLNFDAFMDMCSEYNFMSFINNKENFNMWRRFFEGNYKKTKA